jgi:peptidoglycan/xylan/chitin deacetylase (PgdA/CDA1 family)
MGLSRIVEIDTTGGPGFGFEHFKQYDFLRDKEVVLTFDDGPWPKNTPAVLKALTEECLKATFFEIGEHAVWHPEITKQVIEAGMTVGTHTWAHKDLARNPYAKDLEQAKQEIEMGNSAVHMAAAGAPVAPFFRFPDLQHTPELLSYLGERNMAVFSTDIDSFDFKMRKPDQVVKSVMTKLEKHGKGIILMHDFPARDCRSAAGAYQPAQGGRLQGCPHGAAATAHDTSQIRRNGHAPGQTVVEQYTARDQRRAHHRPIADWCFHAWK